MARRDSKGNNLRSGTVRFTKAQFESALPTHATTGAKLWTYVGIVQGEHCYAIEVRPWVRVLLRSSVRSDNTAAAKGDDSIRMVLDAFIPDDSGDGGEWITITGGPDAWTQRTIGWEGHMRDKIRVMWSIGREVVHAPKHAEVVRMASTSWNRGRIFANDMSHGQKSHTFRWLDRCPHVKTKFDSNGVLTSLYVEGLAHYAAGQTVAKLRAERALVDAAEKKQSDVDEPLFPEEEI